MRTIKSRVITVIILLALLPLMASCGRSRDITLAQSTNPRLKLVDEYHYYYEDGFNDSYVNVIVLDFYTGYYFQDNIVIRVENNMYNDITVEQKNTDDRGNMVFEPFTHYEIKVYYYYTTKEEMKADTKRIIINMMFYDEELIYEERGAR